MPLLGKWLLLLGGAFVLPLLDDFERADGALGANWSAAGVDSGVAISGGTVVQTEAAGADGAYWNAAALRGNPKGVGAKLAAWTANAGDELRLFLTEGPLGGAGGGGGTNGYRARFDRAAVNDNVIISRQDNGVGTDLASGAIVGHFAVGDVLDMLYTPATGAISVRRNRVPILSATDATYDPDTAGFALDGGTPGSPTIEEIYGDALPLPPPPVTWVPFRRRRR